MKPVFNCQHCGKACSDTSIRVPGPHLMGRVLMEQRVCKGCQDRCLAALDAGPFVKVVAADPTKCGTCGDEWGPEGPYYAHRKPLLTGEWKTMPVCRDCFGDYHETCKENSKGG